MKSSNSSMRFPKGSLESWARRARGALLGRQSCSSWCRETRGCRRARTAGSSVRCWDPILTRGSPRRPLFVPRNHETSRRSKPRSGLRQCKSRDCANAPEEKRGQRSDAALRSGGGWRGRGGARARAGIERPDPSGGGTGVGMSWSRFIPCGAPIATLQFMKEPYRGRRWVAMRSRVDLRRVDEASTILVRPMLPDPGVWL